MPRNIGDSMPMLEFRVLRSAASASATSSSRLGRQYTLAREAEPIAPLAAVSQLLRSSSASRRTAPGPRLADRAKRSACGGIPEGAGVWATAFRSSAPSVPGLESVGTTVRVVLHAATLETLAEEHNERQTSYSAGRNAVGVPVQSNQQGRCRATKVMRGRGGDTGRGSTMRV